MLCSDGVKEVDKATREVSDTLDEREIPIYFLSCVLWINKRKKKYIPSPHLIAEINNLVVLVIRHSRNFFLSQEKRRVLFLYIGVEEETVSRKKYL